MLVLVLFLCFGSSVHGGGKTPTPVVADAGGGKTPTPTIPPPNSTDKKYEEGAECGLPEHRENSCDNETNQNYGCTQDGDAGRRCWRSEPGVEGGAEKWCFPVFGKLQSGGRSEKVEALRCFQTSKGVFTISPVLYDCLEVARKSLERGEIFEKNEVPHTYYYCRAGSD